jgi:hypothetical protein
MSLAIMSWAKKQKAGSPSAKTVLMLLADAASSQGQCWPSQATLAEESEQSIDSVQRRLRDLERRGLIYLVSARRWSDSGKWAANMVVVLADSLCVSFALKYGYDPAECGATAGENEALSRVVEKNAEIQPDSAVTVPQIAAPCETDCNENKDLGEGETSHRTADCGMVEKGEKAGHRTAQLCGTDRTALLRYENRNLRTNIPLKSPEPSSAPALDEGSWLSDFNRFTDAWTWADGELLEPVRRKFRDLSPEERVLAIEHIPAYGAEIRRKRTKPMSARTWVSRKGWEPFVLAAKKHPTLAPGKTVPVIRDTPPWFAWLRFRGVRSFPTRKQLVNGRLCDVWDFPTFYPPSDGGHGAQPG